MGGGVGVFGSSGCELQQLAVFSGLASVHVPYKHACTRVCSAAQVSINTAADQEEVDQWEPIGPQSHRTCTVHGTRCTD